MGKSDKDTLIDMVLISKQPRRITNKGFPVDRVAIALNLQDAIMLLTDPEMEYIFDTQGNNKSHLKEIEIDNIPSAIECEAKSLRCSECGKLFKGNVDAEFHASRSGHEKFEESTEEIKPRSEEEKKQRLTELRQKLVQKRALQAQQEKQDKKLDEMIRRKKDAESASLIEEQRRIALLKEVENKKREQQQEILAKKRIKEQIEADKAMRREKSEKEKFVPSESLPKCISPIKSGVGTTARVQFRMNGRTFSSTFNANDTLEQVAKTIEPQSGLPAEQVSFSLAFPRKTITMSERNKTLKELGLVPSAALLLSVMDVV